MWEQKVGPNSVRQLRPNSTPRSCISYVHLGQCPGGKSGVAAEDDLKLAGEPLRRRDRFINLERNVWTVALTLSLGRLDQLKEQFTYFTWGFGKDLATKKK